MQTYHIKPPENDFWGSPCRACSTVSILHNQTVSLAAGITTGYRGKHAAGRVERRFTCQDQVYDGQWEAGREDQKHLRKSTGTHLRHVVRADGVYTGWEVQSGGGAPAKQRDRDSRLTFRFLLICISFIVYFVLWTEFLCCSNTVRETVCR